MVIDSLPALARRALPALFAAAAATSALSAQCPLAWASEPPITGAVYTLLAEPDGGLLVGGSMTSIGSVPCAGLARRSPTGVWSAVDPGPLQLVTALEHAANGDLLAAGTMPTPNGVRHGLVRSHAGATSVVAVADNNGSILDLAVLTDGSIAVCGGGMMEGVQLRTVARFDGVTWTSMGLQMDHNTYAIAPLPNGGLLAGGRRGQDSTLPSNVSRWDGTAWQFLGTSGAQFDISAYVFDVAVLADGSPVMVGNTTSSTSEGVARFDGVTWVPLAGGEVPTYPSTLLALPDGDLLVSGQNPGSAMASRIARWNGTMWTGLASATHSGNFPITNLAQTKDGTVYLSSSLSVSGNLERLVTPCAATATRFGAGCASSSGLVELDNIALPWLGAMCQNRAVGLPANAVALVGFGFQTAVMPLSSLLPAAAPGCFVWQSIDGYELALPSGGALDFDFSVPNHAASIGLAVHLQVATLELQGTAILSSASSNRLTLTIGAF